MADFCKQCGIETFGSDFGDLKGMCADGATTHTICEGCGHTEVDHLGNCVSKSCLLKGKFGHGATPEHSPGLPTVTLTVEGRPIQTLLETIKGLPPVLATEISSSSEEQAWRLETKAWDHGLVMTVKTNGSEHMSRYVAVQSEHSPVPEAGMNWYQRVSTLVKAEQLADPEGYAAFCKFTGNATIHRPVAQISEVDEVFLAVAAAAAQQLSPGWQVAAAWEAQELGSRLAMVRLSRVEDA